MPPITPTVTDGLIDLMKNLTKNVLREKPDNIYEYAATFCENLLLERDGSLDKGYEKFRLLCNQKCSKTVLSSSDVANAENNNPNLEKQIEIPDKELNESDTIEDLNDPNTNEIESSKNIKVSENQLEKLQSIEELNDDELDVITNNDDDHYNGDDDVFNDENVEHHLKNDSDGEDDPVDGDTSNDDITVKKPPPKQRKLSSKKPAENLIDIKEESSTDDIDGEKNTANINHVEQPTPNDLHEIQTEAAIKIQKVFRKYILRQQLDKKSELINDEPESNHSETTLINTDSNLSKDIAASIIQRAFKSFIINKKMINKKIESESIIHQHHQHLSPNNNVDEINENDSGIDDQPPTTDNFQDNLKEFNKYIASAPAYLELTSTDTDGEEGGTNKLNRLHTPGDCESGISEKSFNLHIHEHADDGLLNQENRIDDNTSLSTIEFIQEEDEENYEENEMKSKLLEPPLTVLNNNGESAVEDENLNTEINDQNNILDKENSDNLDKNQTEISGYDTIKNSTESEELLLKKHIPDGLQSEISDDQLKDSTKSIQDNEVLENEINSNTDQNKKTALDDETENIENETEVVENILEKKITDNLHAIVKDDELKPGKFNETIKDVDNSEEKINSITDETTTYSKDKTANTMIDQTNEIQSHINDNEFKPNVIENIDNQIVKDFHENIISEDEENTENSIVTVIEVGNQNAFELTENLTDGIDVKHQIIENFDLKDDENKINNDVVIDKQTDDMNSDSNKGSEITDIIKESIKDEVENVNVKNNIENIITDRLDSEIEKDLIKEKSIEKEIDDQNILIEYQSIKSSVENFDLKDDENKKNNDAVIDKQTDDMISESNKGSKITDIIIKESLQDEVENIENDIVTDRLHSGIENKDLIKEKLIEINDENLSIEKQSIKDETTMDMIEKIDLKDDQSIIIEEVTNDEMPANIHDLITHNEEKTTTITTDKLIGDPNAIVENAEIPKDELINDELSRKINEENRNLNNNDRDTDLNLPSDKMIVNATEKQEYRDDPDTYGEENEYHKSVGNDDKIEYFEDVGLRYVGDLNLNVSTPAIDEESKNAKQILNIDGDDDDKQQNQEQLEINENSLDKSAIKIQKVFRGYSVRKELERNKFTKSATLIQSIFRGFMVRKKLNVKIDKEQSPTINNMYENDGDNKNNIENIAATTIQKNYRGYSVRKGLKSDKTLQNFNINNNNDNTKLILTTANAKDKLEPTESDGKNEDKPLNTEHKDSISTGLSNDELKAENIVDTIQDPNNVLEVKNIQSISVEPLSIKHLNDKNSIPLNENLIESENKEVDDKLNLNDKIEIHPLQILGKIVENNDVGLSKALDDNVNGSENNELHDSTEIIKDDGQVNQSEMDKNVIKDENEIKEKIVVKSLAYETTDDKDDINNYNNNNTAETLPTTTDALQKLDIDNNLAINAETDDKHQISVLQNKDLDEIISVKDLERIPASDESIGNSIVTSLPLSDKSKDESENTLNAEQSNDLIDTKHDVDQTNDNVFEGELNKIEITPFEKINSNELKIEGHLNSMDKTINEEVKVKENEKHPNDLTVEDKILTKNEEEKLSIDMNKDSLADNDQSNKNEAATLIQKNYRGYRVRRDIQNEKPTVIDDSQQSVSSVPQQFSNDFTTELIERNDQPLHEKESNQTFLDDKEMKNESGNPLVVIPSDNKSQIWVLGEYVNDKNLIDAKKKSLLMINNEFKNNNVIPEEDSGSVTPTPDDVTKQFVMPSSITADDDTREKSAMAILPEKIERKLPMQSYSSTIDDSNDESSSTATDQNRFTSSEDELKKNNGKYQSVSYELLTGGSDTDTDVKEMENKNKPSTEHDGELKDIKKDNNSDTVNENIKIRNKDLIDIENFDITNYGEDSLEAMYYSLRKNEIMQDRMHQRAEEERKVSASKDGRNIIDNIERKPLQQRAMSDFGDIRYTLQQQSISYDSENTDNGDVILETLSLNSSTEKNITSPQSIKIPKFDTSHQIEDNSHLDFCLESDSTDTEMDVKPKNEKWPASSVDEEPDEEEEQVEEEEEEHDTFPEYPYENLNAGNAQRKIITSAISEADSDYYEPNAIQSLSIKRLVKDDFNISTAIDHLPQTSTDSDSTIISAATKIQAGARGFLTRRRLRRSSGGGTTTPPSVERPPSFGNAAIDKSLDDLIEQQEQMYLDEAAIKIQRSYRQHLNEKLESKSVAIKPHPLLLNDEEPMDYDVDDSSPEMNVGISKIKVEQKIPNEKLNIIDDEHRENNEKLSNETKNNPSSIISTSKIEHSIDDDIIDDDALIDANNNDPKTSTEEISLNDVLSSNEKSHLSSMNYDDLDTAQRRMTLQRGDAVQRNSTPDSELDTSINNNNNNNIEPLLTTTTINTKNTIKNNVDIFVDKNKLKLDDKPQEVNTDADDDDDEGVGNDKNIIDKQSTTGDNLSNNSSKKNNSSDDVEKSSLNDSSKNINRNNKNTNDKTFIINKRNNNNAPSSASAAINYTQIKIPTQLFLANNAKSNQEKLSSLKVDKSTQGKQNKYRGKNESIFNLGIRQNSMPVQIDSEFIRVIPKHLRKRVKSAGSFRNKLI